MSDFDTFWNLLKDGVVDLAKKEIIDYWQDAVADGENFLGSVRGDLEKWSTALAQGELTPDEFKWLLMAQKDLAEMTALKQAGLAQVRIDKFVNGVVDLAVKAAGTAFL